MDTIFTAKESTNSKTFIISARSTITRDAFNIEIHARTKGAARLIFDSTWPTYKIEMIR